MKRPPLIVETSYFKTPGSHDKYIKLTPKPTIKQRLVTLNRGPSTKEATIYACIPLLALLPILPLLTQDQVILSYVVIVSLITSALPSLYMSSHYYWDRLAEYTLITDSKLFNGVDTEKLEPLSELELALFKLPEHQEQGYIDKYLNEYEFMKRL